MAEPNGPYRVFRAVHDGLEELLNGLDRQGYDVLTVVPVEKPTGFVSLTVVVKQRGQS